MEINTKIQKAPKLQIKPTEHFYVNGIKRSFDLSGLVPLYIYVSDNLKSIKRNQDLEWNIGRATIIYSVDNDNTIHLISGWVGNRKKVAA